jgi:hypothetical protein
MSVKTFIKHTPSVVIPSYDIINDNISKKKKERNEEIVIGRHESQKNKIL